MRDLRAPKKPLRAVPRLTFLRITPPKDGPPTPTAEIMVASAVSLLDGAAPRTKAFSKGLGIIFGAGATGLVAAFIIASFSASGVIDMTLATAFLFLAWLIGIGAVIVSVKSKVRWPAAIGTGFVLGITMLSIGFYERAHFPRPQGKEGARFVFNPAPFDRLTKTMDLGMANKGDVVARASTQGRAQPLYTEHLLTAKEERCAT
jgi:hypothetical protein